MIDADPSIVNCCLYPKTTSTWKKNNNTLLCNLPWIVEHWTWMIEVTDILINRIKRKKERKKVLRSMLTMGINCHLMGMSVLLWEFIVIYVRGRWWEWGYQHSARSLGHSGWANLTHIQHNPFPSFHLCVWMIWQRQHIFTPSPIVLLLLLLVQNLV